MAYRHAASFGKRQEYAAVAELLRRGYDVYMTLVDDQQIDCVVRKEVRGKPVYIDIQIKARSNQCKVNYAGTFAAMEIRKPRKNFFFVFYSERANCYWVVPSLELVKEATQNKSGANTGKYKIVFTNCNTKTNEVRARPRFDKYKNNFQLLEQYKG